jgi:hypothetical protein
MDEPRFERRGRRLETSAFVGAVLLFTLVLSAAFMMQGNRKARGRQTATAVAEGYRLATAERVATNARATEAMAPLVQWKTVVPVPRRPSATPTDAPRPTPRATPTVLQVDPAQGDFKYLGWEEADVSGPARGGGLLEVLLSTVARLVERGR